MRDQAKEAAEELKKKEALAADAEREMSHQKAMMQAKARG